MAQAFFFYKGKKYKFDPDSFEKQWNYSFGKIHENMLFNLIDESDSFQDFTHGSIKVFIDYCQNKPITNECIYSYALQLYFLSKKYQVFQLREQTEEIIKEKHKIILHNFFEGNYIKKIKPEDKFSQSSINIGPKKESKIKILSKSVSNLDVKDINEEENNEYDEESNTKQKTTKTNTDDDDEDKETKKPETKKPATKRAPKRKIKRLPSFSTTRGKKGNKSRKGRDKKLIKSDPQSITDEETSDDFEFDIPLPKDVPQIYEHIISDNFIDYIRDERKILFTIPMQRLYRILVYYSKNDRSDVESERRIIDFLFEYISRKGIDSTFLLSVLDFKADEIEYFNDKLTDYYQYIDFNCIRTKLLQNSRILHQHHKDMETTIFSRLEEIEHNQSNTINVLKNDIKLMEEKLKNQENQILETKLIILSNVRNNIEIPESICSSSFTKFTIPSTFTSISAQNFSGCNILQEIIIPNSVINIEDNAFENCTSLKQIVIPNSVKTIGNYAFANCTNLSQLTIDLYQTKIEENSFDDCSSLNTLVIASTKKIIEQNDFSTLFKKIGQITKIIIPSSITGIGSNCFDGCSSIEQIEISSNVNVIGSCAFSDCSSLTSIEIPYSITEINDKTFNGCSSLKTFTISESIARIGIKAFNGCSSLKQIEIPTNVTNIEAGAFSCCSSLNKIVIPESIVKINDETFSDCTSLSKIILPPSVKTIGKKSFKNCINLEIIIPNSVTSIEDNAFENCTSSKQIVIPNSVKTIGNNSFSNCTNLSQLTIDLYQTKFKNNSFNDCSSLNTLMIVSKKEKIEKIDFSTLLKRIGKITKIIISQTITEIGCGAFSDCSSLTSIILPNSITKIYENTFSECKSLKQISIPPSVTHIYNSAFSGCSSLLSINIPSSVEYIGTFVFNGCSYLTEITIPTSVNQICTYKFKEDSTLQEINLSLILELFKKSVFYNCESLQKITFLKQEILLSQYAEIEQYEIKEKISSIYDIDIYKAVNKSTNKEYAFNTIPDFKIRNFKEFFHLLNSNIEGIVKIQGYHLPLTSEDHQFICNSAYGYPYEKYMDKYIIISDIMEKGNIQKINEEYLNSNGSSNILNPRVRSKIIFGVASIIKKLHENNICNIDLTHNNIYLDDKLEPKIGILPISIYLSMKIDAESIPNYEYIAPEAFNNNDNNNNYNPKSDVYTFGIFLYKMFSQQNSILNKSSVQYIEKIINNERPVKPDEIPEYYWELIEKCWLTNPESRPSFNEIVDILKQIEEEEEKADDKDLEEFFWRILKPEDEKEPNE